LPPHNFQAIALEDFAAKVKERTNGSVEIVVEPGGALGYQGPELLRTVKDGITPISEMVISGVGGDEPIFGLYSLPFMILDWEEARLFDKISRPYFEKAAEKWNQKILYITPWPFSGMWTKRELDSVSDMKGLKTRTYDRSGALLIEATGGTPLALPFSEVYTALATDLIDAVLTSTQTAVDGKFWEVLGYYHPVNATITTSMTTINLEIFNKLSEEQQQILIDAAKEIEEELWVSTEILDKDQEKVCNDNGIVTRPLSEEFKQELLQVSEPIRNEWLEQNPQARELYDEFMKAVGR